MTAEDLRVLINHKLINITVAVYLILKFFSRNSNSSVEFTAQQISRQWGFSEINVKQAILKLQEIGLIDLKKPIIPSKIQSQNSTTEQPLQNSINLVKSAPSENLPKEPKNDPDFTQNRPVEKHPDLTYKAEDTPWLEPPTRVNHTRFNPEFLRWQSERWMKKYQTLDIYEAMADFKSSLLNNPEKIIIRWEEYEMYIANRVYNIKTRLENDVTVTPEEKAQVEKHLPVINRSETARMMLGTMMNKSTPSLPKAEEGSSFLMIDAAVTEIVESVPMNEDGTAENPAAYRRYNSDKIDEVEQRQNIAKLSKLIRSHFKVIPKKDKKSRVDQLQPNSLEEAKQWLHDPALSEVLEKWSQKNGYIIMENENGVLDIYRIEDAF